MITLKDFTSNELHLPINKQVVLKMQSLDVIHSFWVPEFRIKQDVVPGHITEYRITPDLAGQLHGALCGIVRHSHAYMERPVIVTSQADYDAWVQQQAAAAAALIAKGGPDAGKALVAQNGCGGVIRLMAASLSVQHGADFLDHRSSCLMGQTVTADEAYLTESIADPSAKIVDGFPIRRDAQIQSDRLRRSKTSSLI